MQDQNSKKLSSNVIPAASQSLGCIGISNVLVCPTTYLAQNLASSESGQYYKKYEHDEIPVKDVSNQPSPAITSSGKSGANEILNANVQEQGDSKRMSLTVTESDIDKQACVTKSDIDKIEENLSKNLSNQLLISEASLVSLESNIKILKSTVQDILDNYFTSLHDFESYKQRFNEIVGKNRDDGSHEMEVFIEDMIKHITSDSSCSERKIKSNDYYCQSGSGSSYGNGDLETIGTYSTHEGYVTDTEDIANIQESDRDVLLKYLLLDEIAASVPVINLRLVENKKGKLVASADNIKMQAKKQEIELYMLHQETGKSERDIPVRTSCAKKDIRLNEKGGLKGFSNKSYISRLCNFLCRQFRKSV